MTKQRMLLLIVGGLLCASLGPELMAQPQPQTSQDEAWFAAPVRGFISRRPAVNWEHSLLTGNGIQGAMVMGNPRNETLYLSHAALFLPTEKSDIPLDMASHLAKVREDCLKGNFKEACSINELMHRESMAKYGYHPHFPEPFIGACMLKIEQPDTDVTRYQRSIDFMTGEAHVSYSTAEGTFRRSTFVSRNDDVIVVRLAGTAKQTAAFAFVAHNQDNFRESQEFVKRVKDYKRGVSGNFLSFRTVFAVDSPANPICGYEVVGRIVPKGADLVRTHPGFKSVNADEILVLIKIRPLLKGETTNEPAIQKELAALPADYDQLLSAHAKIQGELMERVSFSLDASPADRAKATEDLIRPSNEQNTSLAQIERAFDAGRYNIICSTGYNPPNLQGIWCGTWLGQWGGGMTVDGNLPCAVAFNSMGNTPELMLPYFRYMEQHLPDFRKNMTQLYGMRGFMIPGGGMTTQTGFPGVSPNYPFYFWQAGAAWTCQYYFDHWLYTGDRKFLEERAYPLMKEAAHFYEDFLTVTDKNGHLVFVPTYSPENSESGDYANPINATMEVGAAKQLLLHSIAAAKELDCDKDLQKKWADLIERMPPYEVGPDGSFREWLWPGMKDNNAHRHCSHLYSLYYDRPEEIVGNPALMKGVAYTGRERMKYLENKGDMAFGIVFLGLAAAHTGDAELAGRAINELGKRYWTYGMGSLHYPFSDTDLDFRNGLSFCGSVFNMDISGGFPFLCASTLVYSDPGSIRFFPARPEQWKKGAIKGLRLRGAITLRELTWEGAKAKSVLIADKDQTVTIEAPGAAPRKCALIAGKPLELSFETNARN